MSFEVSDAELSMEIVSQGEEPEAVEGDGGVVESAEEEPTPRVQLHRAGEERFPHVHSVLDEPSELVVAKHLTVIKLGYVEAAGVIDRSGEVAAGTHVHHPFLEAHLLEVHLG